MEIYIHFTQKIPLDVGKNTKKKCFFSDFQSQLRDISSIVGQMGNNHR